MGLSSVMFVLKEIIILRTCVLNTTLVVLASQ